MAIAGSRGVLSARTRRHGSARATALAASVLVLASCAQSAGDRSAPPTEEQIRRDTAEARTQPAAPRSGRLIDRVSVSRKVFESASPEPLQISFDLARAGDVVLRIADETGEPVTAVAIGGQPAGRTAAYWTGSNDRGEAVAPGVYSYAIEMTTPDGERESYPAPGDAGGGDEVLVQQLTLDPATGVVSYLLPIPARVRVRAQLANLPILANLLDWEPQPAGRHSVTWDRKDASGLLDLAGDRRAQVRADAFALPRNAIIVAGAPDAPVMRPVAAPAFAAPSYRHASHAGRDCHEPRFAVEFLDSHGHGSDSPPRVRSHQNVRVTVHPDDEQHLLDVGFELMFFVDLVFVFEEEEGSNPFNYLLDASGLSPGPHFLTINLLSYDDHAAVVTVPFLVEAGESAG